ncbi:MAG: aminopeptidase P family protein [Rhodospirillales bacterium]|nr:aminopeptidase P family protein [Rhodospirillales bacterium]
MTSPTPAPDCAYLGDARLAELLAEARTGKSVADVRTIVGGVLAAPEGYDPDAWMVMVAARPDEALRGQLTALRQAMASEAADGLNAGPPAPAWRLKALRRELKAQGLHGFIVPRADEHQGEAVPAGRDRLRWLTGFNGSAGVAVVLAEKAAIFVDGRYTLQVEDQVRTDDWECRHLMQNPPHDWIAAHLDGGRLGYDPWLHTASGLATIGAAVEKAGGELVACDNNPLDAVWSNRPAQPLAPMRVQTLEHAGRPAEEKIAEIVTALQESGQTAAVLSDPASIAWLLNVRGGDVPDTPVSLCFVLIEATGAVTLFVDRRKVTAAVRGWLPANVTIREPGALGAAIDAVAGEGNRIQVDSETGSSWFLNRISAAGGEPIVAADPCTLPKACKTEAEIAGTRAAHMRDGAALATFLAWLDHATRPGNNIEVDERSASARLRACRETAEDFRGGSFETISGFGPNGAVVHYRVSERTNRRFEPGSLYLVDSGGQYPDGTTDVTRTIAIGEPDADQKKYFTAVLKGHIALATARFPENATGAQLDTLARAPLWALGADFDHGTGHGVGSHLGVHEGPQRISKTGSHPLKPGMIVSNEPGYYRTDAWGIRIENLAVVEEDRRDTERPMMRLSTITKAPIDRRLVEVNDLTDAEERWLDAYHADVRETLTPLVDAETSTWLAKATRPIREGA